MLAFEHAGQRIHDVSAIMRYVDEAFSGPAMMPSTPAERVRVNQLMSIVDNYGYAASITNIFIPRVRVPSLGGQTDEAQVAAARPQAALFLTEVNRLLDGTDYFDGNKVSLADLNLLPVLTHLQATPGDPALMTATPNIAAWMGRMNQCSSVPAVMPSA